MSGCYGFFLIKEIKRNKDLQRLVLIYQEVDISQINRFVHGNINYFIWWH